MKCVHNTRSLYALIKRSGTSIKRNTKSGFLYQHFCAEVKNDKMGSQ